jgi:hypothetical protein
MKTFSLAKNHPTTTRITLFFFMLVIMALCFSLPSRAEKALLFHSVNDYASMDYFDSERHMISIKLKGVTDYELMEIFNDIIVGTPGVLDAKRFRLHIEPKNPYSSYVLWQVELAEIDIAELESRIYRMAKYVSGGTQPFSEPEFTFEPTSDLKSLLAHIKPVRSTSKTIEFILDKPLPASKSQVIGRYGRDRHWHTWGDTGFE